ncbi:glycoside hydrolase family 97 protein [Pyrinomonas methylaliphatogenes]|uniref:glycoside hydrolase family 97 protein n=1 Tax=Pyrinomonas methylaliphatogenes TaxID=454194 RepID=UPI0038B4386D
MAAPCISTSRSCLLEPGRLWLILAFLLSCGAVARAQNEYRLRSPNGRLEARVAIADKVRFSVSLAGAPLVQPSEIALRIEGRDIDNPVVVRKEERSVDQIVRPAVRVKRREIRDRYNELRLAFKNGFGLIFRAYDDGVAYRWTTDLPGEVTVIGEEALFTFDPEDAVYYAEEESFMSHNERHFIRYPIREISNEKLASLPALIEKRSGVKIWLSEADLHDYAGMWLRGTSGAALRAVFPPYPLEERQTSDRDLRVTKGAPYIAKTRGTRSFPWRVLAVAERDADLINNQLVYLLSEGTNEDFSWVRPGKVPWDWWNANNIYGVDFKSGINTQTYKYYIDFAARYGLEYLILDEGWSKPSDLFAINPEINMPELLAYAKQKGVGIILWVVWLTLDKQFERAFDQFERWGIKGIKVDFMQRDDQKMINFYERVAREAARRRMLVDFHGACKPTGLERKYPNVITREGVMGLEHNKWSKEVTPEHNLMLPFTRMVAGPMDYTPGAMINANERDFQPIFARPMSMGTRCHQLAMYVVYESPLQMLADSPSNYLREPDAMEFLARVPTVWDETVVLQAKVGDYIAVARRSASGEWYVGAMTDWTPRDLALDFSFLDQGEYQIDIWQDGVNADRIGNDYKRLSRRIRRGDRLVIHLAPGGGWVARIYKER